MKLYEPAPPARKDELTNVQDGIAVIVDGDTCPVVVESGMYAYIKNNTHGLAEGLYKNTSNSAFPTSGGTADGTVFEADSAGGLNALKASLLWKNTNISTFAPQTIQLDLSKYKFVLVIMCENYTSDARIKMQHSCLTAVGQSGACYPLYTGAGTVSYTSLRGRQFNTSTTGVEFLNGYNVGSSNGPVANEYAIPLFIYGVN